VTGRRGIRRRKLLDDLKERRGYSHLKEEALDRTVWTARFGRGFGPVVRQTAKSVNESSTTFACSKHRIRQHTGQRNSFMQSA
jgi:hypothetical protein